MPTTKKLDKSAKSRPKPLRHKRYGARVALEKTTVIHFGRPAKVNIDRIRELSQEGMRPREIAAELQCSYWDAWYWCRKFEAADGGWRHDWDAGIPTQYLFSGVERLKIMQYGDEVNTVDHRTKNDGAPLPMQDLDLAIFSVKEEAAPDGKLYVQTGKQIITHGALPPDDLGKAIQAVWPLPENGVVVTAKGESWYVVSQTNRIARKHFSHAKRSGDNDIRQLAKEAAGGGLNDQYRDKQAANAKFGGK